MQDNSQAPQEQQVVPPQDVQTPVDHEALKAVMADVEKSYDLNIGVYSVMKLPANARCATLEKLNRLYRAGQEAHQKGNLDLLHDIANQLRHFDSPQEVKAYAHASFMQSHLPNNQSVHNGNR